MIALEILALLVAMIAGLGVLVGVAYWIYDQLLGDGGD